MTAPAIEGGELVKRLRDYDDGRSVDQIDLQADIALRLMDEAAAFIEQSSTLLADAKRERDAALAEIVGLKRVVDLADVALRAMVDEFGGIHDQEGCPEDDTCDCPEAMKLNAAFAAIFKAQHTPSPASGVERVIEAAREYRAAGEPKGYQTQAFRAAREKWLNALASLTEQE